MFSRECNPLKPASMIRQLVLLRDQVLYAIAFAERRLLNLAGGVARHILKDNLLGTLTVE